MHAACHVALLLYRCTHAADERPIVILLLFLFFLLFLPVCGAFPARRVEQLTSRFTPAGSFSPEKINTSFFRQQYSSSFFSISVYTNGLYFEMNVCWCIDAAGGKQKPGPQHTITTATAAAVSYIRILAVPFIDTAHDNLLWSGLVWVSRYRSRVHKFVMSANKKQKLSMNSFVICQWCELYCFRATQFLSKWNNKNLDPPIIRVSSLSHFTR